MRDSELKRLQKARRSVVISLALALLAVATGFAIHAYPWDALVVHGVSLEDMLLAVAPVAALMTLTLLFLWDTGRTTVGTETAERRLLLESPLAEPADLRSLTEQALAMVPRVAERVHVEWGPGPLRAAVDARRAQLGLVGLLASAVEGPEGRARLDGEVGPDGGPRLRLRVPLQDGDHLRPALDLVRQLGVVVSFYADADEVVLDFPPLREVGG